MQHRKIESLETSIGSTYQVQILDAMNATNNLEITADHMTDEELFTALTIYSLQLDRIPNKDVQLVANNLRELAITIKEPYIDIATANQQITEIHKTLSTINGKIQGNPKQWYKSLDK